MADLFSNAETVNSEPLAARMRPRTPDEYIGQEHIMAPGRLLRRAIQADQLSSVIFYGPPGTGKTTLARVIANSTRSHFIALNAVLGGVKEVRRAIEQAEEHRTYYSRRTILFVDEVHRWNKAQQDALLPWVENGTIILIGATTENPFFEVNRALVSRSRIFQLKPLSRENMESIMETALDDSERGYGKYDIVIDRDAAQHLIKTADGDARSLLNALELAVETTPSVFPPPEGEQIRIDLNTAEESIQKKAVLYDKDGDYHFDTISAFIKSLRGSDPDASLYWLAKMIHAGEDPRFLFRRMLIMACEDVGPADPSAVMIVEACAAAFDRVGLPEGQFHLAHAAVYLSTCPKSNSLLGYFDARKAVEEEEQGEVPSHLKDGSRDKGLGHGAGYIYPHSYRDHWAAQPYLPQNMRGKLFYNPSEQGYEREIRNQVLKRRELQLSAMGEADQDEVLTVSPEDRKRELWFKRISETRIAALNAVRSRIFSGNLIQRHHRVLVSERGSPFLVWESLRRTPEGLTAYLNPEQENLDEVGEFTAAMAYPEKPVLLKGDAENMSKIEGLAPDTLFEHFIGRNILPDRSHFSGFFTNLTGLLEPSGLCFLAQTVPGKARPISELLSEAGAEKRLTERLEEIDSRLRSGSGSPLLNWDGRVMTEAAVSAGFTGCTETYETFTEPRIFREREILHWFSREEGMNYGALLKELHPGNYPSMIEEIVRALKETEFQWPRTYLFFTACRP